MAIKHPFIRKIGGYLLQGILTAASLSFLLPSAAFANLEGERKAAAKSFAKEIKLSQFHKVYVADFLDSTGSRTDWGCFFASTFSTFLEKDNNEFSLVNRIQAQSQLNQLHATARDLQQSEVLVKIAAALGADALLVGTADISSKDIKLHVSLRDAASGKEIRSFPYQEKLEKAFLGNFPPVKDAETNAYFFPGLDGVSAPKCEHCPTPEFPDEMRRNRIEGRVLLSAIVGEQGTLEDVRIVEDPGYGLAQRSVEVLRKWRLQPSRDPRGNLVKVRVPIETTFRLYP